MFRLAPFVSCRAALCMAFAVLLPSCVADRVTGERRFALGSWTPEEEMEMGREFAPSVEAQFNSTYIDPEAAEYLGGILEEMVTHSVIDGQIDFHFRVLNSSIPNAFALPGGYVYITRGLLRHMETEGEFLFTMGHEFGHVEHQHAMFQQSRGIAHALPTLPITLVTGLFSRDSIPGAIVHAAGDIASFVPRMSMLKHSRADEAQSDRRGIFYCHEMGYDPRSGIKTFELFEELEKASGGASRFSWFRTHPLNKDRIKDITAEVKRNHPEAFAKDPKSFRQGDGTFAKIIESLRLRGPAYDKHDQALVLLTVEKEGELPAKKDIGKAVRLLEEAITSVPDEPLFHVSRGEIEWLQDNYDAAAGHFEKAAEKSEAAAVGHRNWKPYYYLGVRDLENKENESAVNRLEAAARNFPAHPGIQLVLGVALERVGRKREAIEAFERVMALTPRRSDPYREAASRRDEIDD